jgi:Tfp pilus assembly protein PilE
VVEVCVVLVVLGGLAWLAIPSWLQHRLRLHRVDARTELVSTAQRLTGCFARLGVYDNPACTVALPVATAANTYRLTGEIAAGRFLLRAEPLGEQAEVIQQVGAPGAVLVTRARPVWLTITWRAGTRSPASQSVKVTVVPARGHG